MKARGSEILLVCTGNLKDYRIRNNEYIEALTAFVANESLSNNILMLGLVPYEHVLYLMRNCVAVINPSRFEGWSSTVEEAKSIGKRIALSNIPVHREQAPPGALYFDPDDVHALSSILEKWWLEPAVRSPGAKTRTRCGSSQPDVGVRREIHTAGREIARAAAGFMIETLFTITLAELFMGGGGRLLQIGPFTLRMLLFGVCLLVFAVAFAFRLRRMDGQRLAFGLVLIYLIVHVFGLVVGALQGADASDMAAEFQQSLYWLAAPFFALVLQSPDDGPQDVYTGQDFRRAAGGRLHPHPVPAGNWTTKCLAGVAAPDGIRRSHCSWR